MVSEQQIEDILLRWDELREQGAAPTAEELCRDCPELTAEVARRIAALEAMYRVPNGSGNNTSTLQQTAQSVVSEQGLPRLEDYEILELLGTGGMGKVFKARQTALKRLVALKMILAGRHASPQEAERFRVEAEAVARLQHPNIVQIYEIGQQDGVPFLALEYLEGGNLDRRLQDQPLSARQAAELVRTLAVAVHYAHQRNVVHRDLKPANILLTADGTPKIADFGLAKRLDEALGHTQTGSVLGTPSYMAPEQAEGRLGRIGPATDVYALGAILYQLLTGRPPFNAPTLLETLEKVRSEEPTPPRQERPDLPADLETICLKCLQKEPQDRYASALELADDLQRFLDGEPIHVRSPNLVERLRSTLNRSRRLPDMRRSIRVLAILSPAPFLIQLATYLLTARQPYYPVAAMLASLVSIPVILGTYWIASGEGLRVPLTATTRHLWSIRIGEVLGLFALPLLSWLMHPAGVPWNPLTVFPLWSVLTGVTFFGLGGIYWGRIYLVGLAFIVLGLLMPFRLDLAPLAFGGLFSLILWLLARHIRRVNADADRDDRGLSSSVLQAAEPAGPAPQKLASG